MNKEPQIRITECPRDAMQGWKDFIPTKTKINYLNTLLKVGFDVLDCGSFVSAKAIPQMKDTAEVVKNLDLSNSTTRLLTIVANERGAEEAVQFDPISFLGFPFSVSEEFQRRNTNSGIEESLDRVKAIQELCKKHDKDLLIYISMGFGNPYGETWNTDIVIHWVKKLAALGIERIALADTIGVSTSDTIRYLFTGLLPEVPGVQFGAHLHARQGEGRSKIQAAFEAGCRSFDVAMKGIGGCPMANDTLVGNLATEELVAEFNGPEALGLDADYFAQSLQMASEIF